MTNEHVAILRVRVLEITLTTHGHWVPDKEDPEKKIWQQCPARRFKCVPVGPTLPDTLLLQAGTKECAFDVLSINPKVWENINVNSEFELPFYEVEVK